MNALQNVVQSSMFAELLQGAAYLSLHLSMVYYTTIRGAALIAGH